LLALLIIVGLLAALGVVSVLLLRARRRGPEAPDGMPPRR
jgi:hypothetical protein